MTLMRGVLLLSLILVLPTLAAAGEKVVHPASESEEAEGPDLEAQSSGDDAPSQKQRILEALALIPGSPFDAYSLDHSAPQAAATTSKVLRKILTKTPSWVPGANSRRAIEKIRQLVDPNAYREFSGNVVGGSNDAILAFQRRRLHQNPCFNELSARFYSEVRLLDREFNSCRANLQQTCAVHSMKPGWLWDLAMKRSGGDTGLAMALIGVCGHDDIGQGAIFPMDPSAPAFPKAEVVQVIEEQIDNDQSNLLDFQSEQSREPSDDIQGEIIALQKKIRATQTFLAQVKSGQVVIHERQSPVYCPEQDSVFYFPQSLGKEADIPQSLKERVANIQAPEQGAQVLPAKYYHVYGSAFLACEAIQSGGHPKMVQQAAKSLGWAYRTVRMQEVVQTGLDELKSEENDYRRSQGRSAPAKSLEQWRKDQAESVIQEYMKDLTHLSPEERRTQEQNRREVFEKEWAERDAARIFDDLTIGKTIRGVSMHTNFRFPWQGDPVKRYLDEKTGRAPPSKAPKGWSNERYDRARLKALTYLVDWEWTIAQHEAGAAFAASHCKPRGLNFKDLDDLACVLLPSSSGAPGCQPGTHDAGMVKAVDALLPAVEAAGKVESR